jgi:putative endopeptidase
VQLVNGTMGEALGQLYVGKALPEAARATHAGDDQQPARSLQTVDHDARLDDAGHQERSARKLAAFRPKIGYPPKWKDYSSSP